MNNVILYLIGFPGVGKLTTAKEFCKLEPSFKIIDNHIPANMVFSFSDATENPLHLEYRTKARNLMLDAIADLAKPEDSFVFTNVLCEGDNSWFDPVQELAEKRGALFVPIILTCDRSENEHRIVQPERREKLKATDVKFVDESYDTGMICFEHPNKHIIDNTFLFAPAAALRIRQIIHSLYEKERAL